MAMYRITFHIQNASRGITLYHRTTFADLEKIAEVFFETFKQSHNLTGYEIHTYVSGVGFVLDNEGSVHETTLNHRDENRHQVESGDHPGISPLEGEKEKTTSHHF